MTKSMLVQQDHTHLLLNNHLEVKHNLVDNVSEKWKFGHLKLMVQHTHYKKCLQLNQTM